jgi:hypothetical protein
MPTEAATPNESIIAPKETIVLISVDTEITFAIITPNNIPISPPEILINVASAKN